MLKIYCHSLKNKLNSETIICLKSNKSHFRFHLTDFLFHEKEQRPLYETPSSHMKALLSEDVGNRSE